MSSLSRELVFLILQFLDEEKFKETVHKLEQESGFFFNMKYFEDQVQAGEWEEVERYLSGFTKVDDNRYSMKIFFEIRKQKYLEALDKQDRARAVEILVKDLKVFSSFNEELFKEITQLLTLDNFRRNGILIETDAQLCLWGIDGWDKRKSKLIQVQSGRPSSAVGDTRVQFHNDQVHLLVVHESQLAIYDASKLERLRYWAPRDSLSATISSAIYSCDSLLVYASFCDGAIGVFDAESLRPRCRIAPSAYIPPGISSGNPYPLVIASHPSEPNQFALGMIDGGVHVIEPLDSEGKWGVGPPPDNGTVGSNPTVSNQGSEPPPR